jgi:hypothetical protein
MTACLRQLMVLRFTRRTARTEPLSQKKTPDLLECMRLTDLSTQLSVQIGRPVNFMIYSSIDEAMQRSPTIVVPKQP